MPLASLTSVANSPVRRRRISSLGSKHFASVVKILRLVFRSHRIFGAVKPVEAGLGHHLIKLLRPPAALDLFALGTVR